MARFSSTATLVVAPASSGTLCPAANRRMPASSVAPVPLGTCAPCVLGLLGFRATIGHRTYRGNHPREATSRSSGGGRALAIPGKLALIEEDERRADADLIRKDFCRRNRQEPPVAVAADDLEPDQPAGRGDEGVHGPSKLDSVRPDRKPEQGCDRY